MTKTTPAVFPWSVTDDEARTRPSVRRPHARDIVNVTTETLLEKIRAAGLLVIAVDAVLDRANDMVFAGDVETYLNAVKSLHGNAIFLSTTRLGDDDFVCELDSDDDGAEPAPRDLCVIQPRISKFKSNIGSIGQFDLAAYTNAFGLTLSIVTDWYGEFQALRADALDALNEEVESENTRRESEQEMRLQDGLQKLEALSSDRAFMGLSTQRAMRAYALEHIPELANIDDHDLRTAIADLKARIQARGLTRR